MANKLKIGLAVAAAIAIATPVIETYEGTETETYWDTGHVATVCTGHTGLGVYWNKIYTKEECRAFLEKDLQTAGNVLKDDVKVDVTPDEAAAYLSFVYNVGRGNFESSTLLKKLNAGDHVGACKQLLRWVYDNGQRLLGLERRRQAEYQVCMQGADRSN